MKMLVTGGAGFMGSHIAEELIKDGHNVFVLDDLSGGFEENVPDEAILAKGSVTDTETINRLFEQHRFDYVYHLAAYAAEGLSFFIKKFNYENNLIGSINLINASVNHNVKCFVFTSSIAVYGSLEPPFTEDMIPHPEDPYGVAKYAVESDLRISKEIWDMNYIIFRPHNVYGERQNIGDKYRNILGIFMNQIMTGQNITIFGDGEQTRAFTYIKDVSHIIANSVFNKKAYNQIINIGSDKPYSVNYLAETVLKTMDAKNKIVHLPPRKEVVHAYSSHQKMKEIFGCETKICLEEGVKMMADWARRVGSKKSKEFSNVEVYRNMPESWR